MCAIFRRQHESRLGIIELAGNRLHLRGREPLGIKHHSKRIAAKRAVGEHVHSNVTTLH